MSESTSKNPTRRQFLKDTGRVAAATTLVSVATAPHHVHAAEDNKIRVALIGCGGRGTGAAMNALTVDNGPIELVAMADVFENKLKSSYASLAGSKKVGDKVDVPEDRRFIGFDAYAKAMDCLRPGDIAIFTTPCAFRWVHFTYAIEKELNVFMEKPVTADCAFIRTNAGTKQTGDRQKPESCRRSDVSSLRSPSGVVRPDSER